MTDSTPAIDAIERSGIPFDVVRTERAHSAEESAELQGIELGALLRTIVVRRGEDDYVFVLVPGGRRFDWPKVRAHLGVKRLSLPDADEAREVTGYERGAITPFGASRAWPVIVDASAIGLGLVAIGGGAHGVNLHLAPADLVAALEAEVVDVTMPEGRWTPPADRADRAATRFQGRASGGPLWHDRAMPRAADPDPCPREPDHPAGRVAPPRASPVSSIAGSSSR